MAKTPGIKLHEGFKRARALNESSKSSDRIPKLLTQNAFLRETIDPEWLQEEKEILLTRWIEYRYMDPLECTQLFTELYEDAVREFYGKYFDYSYRNQLRPIQRTYARNNAREMSQLWRARQEADRIGAPYGFFIRTAMESMLIGEGHKNIPRPNQLYSDRPLRFVGNKWFELESVEVLFRDNWDERFFANSYCGDPVQEAALALLVNRVNGSPHPERALRNYLQAPYAISEHQARLRLGDSIVEKALEGIASPAIAAPTTALRRFAPACLGLSLNEGHSACKSCFAVSACRQATAAVDKDLIARFGSVDPRATKLRADNRERQRRCREKKSAARTLAGFPDT